MPKPEDDAQLSLKKRARRRLVGATALALLAAVVLPMVMDQAPQSPVQDVQIRIPGQDDAPPLIPRGAAERSPGKPAAAPAERVAGKPVASAAEKPAAGAEEKPAEKPAEKPLEKVAEKPAEKATEKAAAKPADKAAERAAEKPPAVKPAGKTTEKLPEKPAAKAGEKVGEKAGEKAVAGDAQRAADILAGKANGEAAKPAAGGEHVILIGAFANPANVKQLQGKLGELGIKVYTEALDSPQGKKTRVRAGPFANREAAEKALDRMKRIGVNGVVAAKP